MSHRQAKKLRREQRAAGIVPKLDKKRRDRQVKLDMEHARIEAAAKFKREHPEEWARQQQASLERGRRAIQTVIGAIGMFGGLR